MIECRKSMMYTNGPKNNLLAVMKKNRTKAEAGKQTTTARTNYSKRLNVKVKLANTHYVIYSACLSGRSYPAESERTHVMLFSQLV